MPAVIIKKEKEQTDKKIVIVVSKKVSPKATERNRLKRRIRAILAERCKETKDAYKVIVKPEAKKLSFDELKQEIEKQLS
ncbi:MAG: ribonuclease P protein component [bacterium]|nr:ribonuclease P protein component [bacterium]